MRSVSQPFGVLESQSPRPGSQLTIAQLSEPQVSLAYGRLQIEPHAPQLLRVVSEVSHPLGWRVSQFSHPPSQLEMRHAPVSQVSLACSSAQIEPHAPQCESVRSDCSQPLTSSRSQSPQPGSQLATRHVPAAQVALA